MEPLISYLKKVLIEPLPGVEAQAIMMPSMSDKSRFSLAAKDGAKAGGVMILLYMKDGEWYFPLIQRPDYDGVHAKQMSFPGGKKDVCDKNLINTALRETEEEVGILQSKIKVLGCITELYIIASNYNVLPTIGIIEEEPQFFADEHEVDEVIAVKLADLMNKENQKEMPMTILQGISITAPFFHLNNKVVWGATSMILSEFRTLLKPFFNNTPHL